MMLLLLVSFGFLGRQHLEFAAVSFLLLGLLFGLPGFSFAVSFLGSLLDLLVLLKLLADFFAETLRELFGSIFVFCHRFLVGFAALLLVFL